jgi:hypothetical protein
MLAKVVMENVRRYRAMLRCTVKPRPSVHFKAGLSWRKPKGGNISRWGSSKPISSSVTPRLTIYAPERSQHADAR